MAQAWMTLADHVEKYGEVTLIYETPPSSPEAQQQVAQQQQQPQPKKEGN